jgi:hypothetical protein
MAATLRDERRRYHCLSLGIAAGHFPTTFHDRNGRYAYSIHGRLTEKQGELRTPNYYLIEAEWQPSAKETRMRKVPLRAAFRSGRVVRLLLLCEPTPHDA